MILLSIRPFVRVVTPKYHPIYLFNYQYIYQSILLSFYLWSIHASIYPYLQLSGYLSILIYSYLAIYLSLFIAIYLSIYLKSCLSIFPSNSTYIGISIRLSIITSKCLFISIYLSVYLSIYLCVTPRYDPIIPVKPNYLLIMTDTQVNYSRTIVWGKYHKYG